MSSAKLTAAIQKHVIKILKRDLRKELNTLIPELEIDKADTIKWLKGTYFKDLEDSEASTKAEEAFQFIIKDIKSKKNFEMKHGVAGKPYIFTPTGSRAKDKYKVVSNWKTKLGAKLDKEFGVGKDFGSDFHLGHGNSSIPTVGYRHVKAAKYLAGKGAGDEVLDVIRDTPLIKELKVMGEVDMVLKQDSKFRKNFTVRLKLQLGSENLKESHEEKELHKKATKDLVKVLEKIAVEEPTSPSSVKAVSDAVTRQLKGKKPKTKRSKSKATVVYKNPKKGKERKAKPKVVMPLRTNKGKFTSAMNIQAILDQRIKQQVQDNMGEGGALVNRTGRFASSVTVEKVMQSRQGVLTAFYTYMKAPYQTFERGFAQGSLRRDPRKLISRSIREIAAETLNHKLPIRTRRV